MPQVKCHIIIPLFRIREVLPEQYSWYPWMQNYILTSTCVRHGNNSRSTVCFYVLFHFRDQRDPTWERMPSLFCMVHLQVTLFSLSAECTWQQYVQLQCLVLAQSYIQLQTHGHMNVHTGSDLPCIIWHKLCHSITPISAYARTNKTKILSHWELASGLNDCRITPPVTT